MELAEICVRVGFCKSKTEARRHIAAGAIRVDDKKITDPKAQLYVNMETKTYCLVSSTE